MFIFTVIEIIYGQLSSSKVCVPAHTQDFFVWVVEQINKNDIKWMLNDGDDEEKDVSGEYSDGRIVICILLCQIW